MGRFRRRLALNGSSQLHLTYDCTQEEMFSKWEKYKYTCTKENTQTKR